MIKIIIALAVILGTFVFFGDSIEHSLNAFLLAGIIPGTSWQLPWYITLLSTPILLYGVYRLFASMLSKNKPRKTEIIKNETSKKTPSSKNKSTTSKAKKSPAKPKKSQAKKKKTTKKSTTSASQLTRAQA